MAKRGFFAELQHQNQMAAKRQLQAERAHARAYAAAQREAEQAQRRADRAVAAYERATVAEQKEMEKEAKRLHAEAQVAEVASLNAHLAELADELDSILSATLDVDDFVDLELFRTVAEHPPFARVDLEQPTAAAAVIEAPPEPSFVAPEAPKGLSAMFAKKKHVAAVAVAEEAFRLERESWEAEAAKIPGLQLKRMQKRDADEQRRVAALQLARGEYQMACEQREADAAAANRQLDDLISGVAAGQDAAIQEYVGVVLSNSVYPELLEVEHEFEFDSALRELSLTVLISPPGRIPEEKEYRWLKARDEIVASLLPKKDLKARYAGVIDQVALRSVHEVFEADRAGHIDTIALSVASDATDPATGRPKRTTLVAVAAERESFLTFDLAKIVPSATLQHLGASVSKNPYELAGIDGSQGVRSR